MSSGVQNSRGGKSRYKLGGQQETVDAYASANSLTLTTTVLAVIWFVYEFVLAAACTAAAGLRGLIGSLPRSVYHAFHAILLQTTDRLTEGQTSQPDCILSPSPMCRRAEAQKMKQHKTVGTFMNIRP